MDYIEQADRPWGKYYVIHDCYNFDLKLKQIY